jgi:hypothetical protein
MARAGAQDRIGQALDPASGGFRLWRLAARGWFSRALLRELAANPRLPRALLWCLAIRRWDVRAAVAANPRCPRPLLRSMARAHDWAVRAALTSQPVLSPALLNRLIRRSAPCVRLYAAASPSLTPALADRLLADQDPYVRGMAAGHPAASAAALSRLAEGLYEPAWILRRIAANPSCPADLADQLLTWISLGGAEHSDPMFDPVECTGHPADTRVSGWAWYKEQAEAKKAERHALWRVRESVASGRVFVDQVWVLARDPRPEVRRRIAARRWHNLNIVLELRRDADPAVARTAAATLKRHPLRRKPTR